MTGMPEETLLIAAASILRTNAVERIERVQEQLTGLDAALLDRGGREDLIRAVSADLAIAAAASKAADMVDEVIREANADSIRRELG